MNTWTTEAPLVNTQNLSLMLLASDLLYKALEMHCSDLQVEHEGEQVTVRFLVQGQTAKEMQLPCVVHGELVFCYKALAGLSIKRSTSPQDKQSQLHFAGQDVGLRVTVIPGELGETLGVTFKYPAA